MQYFCSIRLLLGQNARICSQNYHRSKQKITYNLGIRRRHRRRHRCRVVVVAAVVRRRCCVIVVVVAAVIIVVAAAVVSSSSSLPLSCHCRCRRRRRHRRVVITAIVLSSSSLLSPPWSWSSRRRCIVVVVGPWLGRPQVHRQGGSRLGERGELRRKVINEKKKLLVRTPVHARPRVSALSNRRGCHCRWTMAGP
jgi:hypothetical protein